MATAFTPSERKRIYNRLQKAALHFAATSTMKHTTVDELAQEAGISKGAFYGFFDSKEQLFLTMAQHLQRDMYQKAEKVWRQGKELPCHERAMKTVYELCAAAKKHHLTAFMQEEMPLLLKKIPDQVIKENYMTDQELIGKLLLQTGAVLKTSLDVACTAIHVLMLTLTFQKEAGENFDAAMKVMVEGTCERVFA